MYGQAKLKALGGLLIAGMVVAAPSEGAAQDRTPATLSTNRIEFRRVVSTPQCLAAAQNVLQTSGWNNITVNDNQTAMAGRSNVVIHVVCTPRGAFIAAAGSGVSPSAFVDEVRAALASALGQ
jgi:hypothetical protein